MISIETTKQSERKMGLSVLGCAPFGTHFCLFYKTKEDLLDILVPYFKAGLENNEFCIWITAEPLSTQDAKEAMRKALPNLAQHLQRGQFQIIPHTEWYLKGGAFNLQRILNEWIEKLNQALARGYDGVRVTGDAAWLEKRNWRDFTQYEEKVNKAIDKYRMLAICSYCIDKCGASEVLDVTNTHRFALIRREGAWQLLESSERKKAMADLRASQSKYETLVENLPQKIFLKDKDSVYVSCNENYARDLKIKAEEIAGKTDYDFYPEQLAEKYRADDRRIIESGVTKGIEEKYIVDGQELTVHTVKTPVRDERGNVTGILGIFWDITERKQLEKLLRESEKLAAKGQLAAQVAHEINNPLAGIKNSFMLVKDAIPQRHPCYQYVSLIDKEIERLSDIIRQMFTLYQPNETVANEFSIDDAMRDIAILLEPTCRRHSVVISVDTSNKPAVVTLPEALVRQVLFNIIKNAIEASPKGGQVEVAARVTESTLTLAVSDQGNGIAEQWHDRIFEPSFTTKKGLTTSGLGFGLSVTKNIVESMGGHLRFESKSPSQGTVFTIVVPLGGARKVAQYG
jgi:PAS domain S-box-containing protein